jgi:predicted molibdopterin-dependent oxidoreductase YjgC
VPAENIRQAARLFGKAERAAIIYSMGITQHTTGVDNVLALADLAMLTGNIGREGAGVNPLRGQNNVQGACDVGCLPNVLTGYQRYTEDETRQKFEQAWTCELACEAGMTLTEMFDAAAKKEVKAMYILGENPVLSDPDIKHIEEALKSLDFLVVQDIFLTETAAMADVVLPGVSFAEKDGTYTNTERRVQRVRRVIKPLKGTRQDWQIISDVSTALGHQMSYTHPSEIMAEIASVTPAYGGIRYERLENGGLQWPCPTVDHPGTPILHRESFTRGKGKFHAVEYKPPAEVTDKNYPLILTTGRVLTQYHTRTMTGRSEGIDDVTPRKLVEVNPVDAEKYGVNDGEAIIVSTRRGKIKAKAKVTDNIISGTIFIPFHYAQAAANRLTNPALDPIAKIPEFKVAAARIKAVTSD